LRVVDDDKLTILNLADFLRRAQLFSKRNPGESNLKDFNEMQEIHRKWSDD